MGFVVLYCIAVLSTGTERPRTAPVKAFSSPRRVVGVESRSVLLRCFFAAL